MSGGAPLIRDIPEHWSHAEAPASDAADMADGDDGHHTSVTNVCHVNLDR